MKFIISIFIALVPLTMLAQKADSVKADTVKHKRDFLPTGIRVGTDVISLIRTATEDDFSGYEFNAEIDFYRYYLAVEAGRWEKDVISDEENYSNSGNYMRIGVDVNFLLKDPDRNVLFFGFRYGTSTYSEDLTLISTDPIWGSSTATYSNDKINASWGELTTGLRVKMWKFFWMGYTARYKFALNTNEPAGLISYDVPGYGRTGNSTTWGFNYLLLFRMPVRKQK